MTLRADQDVVFDRYLATNHMDSEESSELLSFPLRRFFGRSAIVLMATLGFMITGYVGYRVRSVMQQEAALKALQADYSWNHTDTFGNDIPGTHSFLASYLGNATVSAVSSVRLEDKTISDQDVAFIRDLKHLQKLELDSQKITDHTLEIISQLPDLRYLSLAGNQFSIFGLLQLRQATNLQRLEINTEGLTDSELAVLRSELGDVQVTTVGHLPETKSLHAFEYDAMET